MSPDDIKPRYLGDGVYAYFDGYQIWLGLHPGAQLIALEPAVMRALRDYQRAIGDSLTRHHTVSGVEP